MKNVLEFEETGVVEKDQEKKKALSNYLSSALFGTENQ